MARPARRSRRRGRAASGDLVYPDTTCGVATKSAARRGARRPRTDAIGLSPRRHRLSPQEAMAEVVKNRRRRTDNRNRWWADPIRTDTCACSRPPICSASARPPCAAGPTPAGSPAERTPSGQRRFLARRPRGGLCRRRPVARCRRTSLRTRDEQRYQLLFETSLELASSLDLDEVLQSAARRLSAALQIPDCDIYRLEGDGRMVCLASSARRRLRRRPGWARSSASRTGPASGSPSRRGAPSP